jgi:hypothetical protein
MSLPEHVKVTLLSSDLATRDEVLIAVANSVIGGGFAKTASVHFERYRDGLITGYELMRFLEREIGFFRSSYEHLYPTE